MINNPLAPATAAILPLLLHPTPTKAHSYFLPAATGGLGAGTTFLIGGVDLR